MERLKRVKQFPAVIGGYTFAPCESSYEPERKKHMPIVFAGARKRRVDAMACRRR